MDLIMEGDGAQKIKCRVDAMLHIGSGERRLDFFI